MKTTAAQKGPQIYGLEIYDEVYKIKSLKNQNPEILLINKLDFGQSKLPLNPNDLK